MCAILVLFRFSFDDLIAVSEGKAREQEAAPKSKAAVPDQSQRIFLEIGDGGQRGFHLISFGIVVKHVTGRVVCARESGFSSAIGA